MGEACEVKIEWLTTAELLSVLRARQTRMANAAHYQRRPAPDAEPIRIQPAANRGAVKAGAGWGRTVEPHAAANTRPASAIRKEPGVTYCPAANLGSQHATMKPDEAAQMRQYYEDQANGYKREYKKRWYGKKRSGKARTSKNKEI